MTTEPAPSEVRRRVLSGHRALREQLLELRRECSELAGDGAECLDALRLRAEAVKDALDAQIDLEARVLIPVLEEIPGFGDIHAEDLTRHHVEQRRLYAELVALIRSGRPNTEVAPEAQTLLDLLRREFVWEDRELLDPEVVKDDTIDISIGG